LSCYDTVLSRTTAAYQWPQYKILSQVNNYDNVNLFLSC
jgi:hypothetical protein